MQKLGTGYTMYFNVKYHRNGVLFQGAFKALHVDQESYFTHLTRYIHLNPAELREPSWKEKGIKNIKNTIEFVKKYPWSSLRDYLNQSPLRSILNMDMVKELILSPKEYESYLTEWVAEYKDLLGTLTLED